MSRPRVLLVEDEPAVQRFVEAALEDMDIALDIASGVAQALDLLATETFALVLTDLMLEGESGHGLVRRLHDDPALGGRPRVAVFSAGLTPQVSADLEQLGAWRLLHKPVPVQQLRQCVVDAVDAVASAGVVGSAGDEPTAVVGAAAAGLQGASAAPPTPAQDVVQTYFGGKDHIYEAYRRSCEAQFPHDLATGDRAFAAGDAGAMRQLCHSLKSVLAALGHPQAAEVARCIDLASRQGEWSMVERDWPVLRTALASLVAQTAVGAVAGMAAGGAAQRQ